MVRLAVSGSNLSGDVPFSAALAVGGQIRSRRSPPGERGDLATLCRDLCAEARVVPADVREVLVDVGPGSYTGLRVALTFVRFLQAFGDVRVQAVDSLAWMSRVGLAGDAGGQACSLLDARRGRFCFARHEFDGERLAVREASAALLQQDALARIGRGDIAVVPAQLAEQIGEDLRQRGAEVRVVRELVAESLFTPGLPLVAAAAEHLEPRYLMASYAEA